MTRFLCILLILVPLGAAQAGCGAIGEKPRSSVDARIESTIRDAGSNPSDWIVDNDCHIAGSCSATAAPAAVPDSVIAYNRYIVKDSRATLKGDDRIRAAVEEAVDRNCFGRFGASKLLVRCLEGDT